MRGIFFIFLFLGMNAFAGGSEVGNPWPGEPSEMVYLNSIREFEAILKSQTVARVLAKHGAVSSIVSSGDGYIVRTANCGMTVNVTYDLPVIPPQATVHILKTDCYQ